LVSIFNRRWIENRCGQCKASNTYGFNPSQINPSACMQTRNTPQRSLLYNIWKKEQNIQCTKTHLMSMRTKHLNTWQTRQGHKHSPARSLTVSYTVTSALIGKMFSENVLRNGMLANGFSASSFSFLHVQKFPVINCMNVTHSPPYSINLSPGWHSFFQNSSSYSKVWNLISLWSKTNSKTHMHMSKHIDSIDVCTIKKNLWPAL
jgi:hypothetical protein